jgi:hypothetical protein
MTTEPDGGWCESEDVERLEADLVEAQREIEELKVTVKMGKAYAAEYVEQLEADLEVAREDVKRLRGYLCMTDGEAEGEDKSNS